MAAKSPVASDAALDLVFPPELVVLVSGRLGHDRQRVGPPAWGCEGVGVLAHVVSRAAAASVALLSRSLAPSAVFDCSVFLGLLDGQLVRLRQIHEPHRHRFAAAQASVCHSGEKTASGK